MTRVSGFKRPPDMNLLIAAEDHVLTWACAATLQVERVEHDPGLLLTDFPRSGNDPDYTCPSWVPGRSGRAGVLPRRSGVEVWATHGADLA